MKIIAFAGSNSKQSINKKLATYAASLFEGATVEVLDLNDFEMPLFSVDLEKEIETPEAIGRFLAKIRSADLLIVSLAENNNSFNAGFKNIFDWNSRIEPKQFQNKPMLLMATSSGARGGSNVLEHAAVIFPRHNAIIKATFSLPSFRENFEDGTGITYLPLDDQLKKIVKEINN
ncbi:MAG: NAD(P)H-dependent oxidoreductase [Ferruginibacter sp.]